MRGGTGTTGKIHRAFKVQFLLLLIAAALAVLSGCAEKEYLQIDPDMPQQQADPSQIEDDVLTNTDGTPDTRNEHLQFRAAVDSQPAWSAVVDWYYSGSDNIDDVALEDFCIRIPLEQSIYGLKDGNYDVIILPCGENVSRELEGYEIVPLFKDAVIFIRSNSTDNAGYDLGDEQIKRAYTGDNTVYWDEAQTDPVIPAAGYTEVEEEIWQQIFWLFGFDAASDNVLYAVGFDNPVQAVIDSERAGSGLWPYYYGRLSGDMGLNGEVVSINGVSPSNISIADGSYPYTLNYCAAFSSENAYYDEIIKFIQELEHQDR